MIEAMEELGGFGPGLRTPIQAGGCLPAASEAGQMTASDHAPRQAVHFPLPRGGRPQMESGLPRDGSRLSQPDQIDFREFQLCDKCGGSPVLH